MKYLYMLDELLMLQSNGWSCADCGKAWITRVPGLHIPLADTPGDPDCRHPKLLRALVSR